MSIKKKSILIWINFLPKFDKNKNKNKNLYITPKKKNSH